MKSKSEATVNRQRQFCIFCIFVRQPLLSEKPHVKVISVSLCDLVPAPEALDKIPF